MASNQILDQLPTTLVQQMCSTKLDPYTKTGAISEGMKNLGFGTLFLVIGIVGSIVMFTSDISYEEMGRTLGRTFGWLGLLFVPFLPFFPYFFVMLAVVGAGWAIYGATRASAAKAMGAFEFRCPKCQKDFSFTRSLRKFEIVCPDCYTLIFGNKTATIDSRRCDYCELVFFAPVDTPFQCPSCQYKVGARQTSCTRCKKPIPKNVLFCRECHTWIGLPETYLGSFATPTTHYDVGHFSSTTCQAYALELENRIALFTDQLFDLGTAGSIPIQSCGSTVVAIKSSLHLLQKCTLTAQWLYVRKEHPPAELLNRLAVNSERIRDALQKLQGAIHWNKKDKEKFWPIVSEACATFVHTKHAPN